jgi:hypothetical protein
MCSVAYLHFENLNLRISENNTVFFSCTVHQHLSPQKLEFTWFVSKSVEQFHVNRLTQSQDMHFLCSDRYYLPFCFAEYPV